jgi:phenylacetate-CoA ligase
LTNIAAYRGAYTTAIVVAYLQEAGCIRVNLSPDAWRKAGDCAAYLDQFWAPVMLGDPHAFAMLLEVDIRRAPAVLVSCITHLSDAFAEQLARRYGAQVIDLYALTEAGIVAVRTPQGHAVLPHDLHVEVLDEHDEPCPTGVVGEVVLTGGRNPFLPLLRYRTGDYAALAWHDGRATLVGLEGRRPVHFPTAARVVHSMEVTRLMRRFPLVQYQLHQNQDGGFRFAYRGMADPQELRDALGALLGTTQPVHVEELPPPTARQRKHIVYHSLHPDAASQTQ